MTTSPTGKAAFGLIGLGVMGQNLVQNVARHGFPVVVWNRSTEAATRFAQDKGGALPITAAATLAEFTQTLKRPRRIMLLVKAGEAVDLVIEQLKPYLEPGDIVIDGGNSNFPDTRRREKALAQADTVLWGSVCRVGKRARFGGHR